MELPYLMPKPDCTKHLDKLELSIRDAGYHIERIYKVDDWLATAREIYKHQLDVGDEAFVNGFESHAWILNYLFGNRSLVLLVDKNNPDLADNLESKLSDIYSIKQSFRQKMKGCDDGSFLALLNLSKIADLPYEGQEGVLGVSKSDSFSPFDITQELGSWDYVFFKYVHCPDPNPEQLRIELAVLEKVGILSPQNIVSYPEWEQMKYQQTMIPPSEYKGEKR